MTHRHLICLSTALALAGCATAANPPATPAPIQAVDLRNTVCPVSGDNVGTSKLVEVADGKIYHLCCDSCHADFEKDPAKYEKMVSDDPAKYGIH